MTLQQLNLPINEHQHELVHSIRYLLQMNNDDMWAYTSCDKRWYILYSTNKTGIWHKNVRDENGNLILKKQGYGSYDINAESTNLFYKIINYLIKNKLY